VVAESSSKTSLPQWFQWTLNTADRAVSRSKLQVTRVTVVTSISLEHAARWSTGSSVWTWGRTSSLWGWRSPGTGRPGRLWILLLWRYSKPAWTRSCAACCRWSCFSSGGWTRWPTEVPSNPQHSVILWFCEAVETSAGQAVSSCSKLSLLPAAWWTRDLPRLLAAWIFLEHFFLSDNSYAHQHAWKYQSAKVSLCSSQLICSAPDEFPTQAELRTSAALVNNCMQGVRWFS